MSNQESPHDFIAALLTMVLLVVAAYVFILVASAYVPMVPR